MSHSLPNTLNKCGECGSDFYGAHLKNCTKEEALEVCSKCEQFYLNSSSPYIKNCICNTGDNEPTYNDLQKQLDEGKHDD